MNANDDRHDTPRRLDRNQHHHGAPAPLEPSLPAVLLTLTPDLEPLHYRLLCRDLAEQRRVLPRVEAAWRIFVQLAAEGEAA